MDKSQMKQHAQALALAKQCSRMMTVAQAAADSDDPALQAMAAPLAEQCAKMLGAYKAAFPGMAEPDGDEVMMSAEEAKGLKDKADKAEKLSADLAAAQAVITLCETLTGKKGVELKPALVLLGEKADQVVVQAQASEEQQRLTLLDALIKPVAEGGLQKVLPSQRPLLETFTLSELEAYRDSKKDTVGPKVVKPVEGSAQIDGAAPPVNVELAAAEAAAQKDAFALLGLSPDSPWLKPGQGIRTPAL